MLPLPIFYSRFLNCISKGASLTGNEGLGLGGRDSELQLKDWGLLRELLGRPSQLLRPGTKTLEMWQMVPLCPVKALICCVCLCTIYSYPLLWGAGLPEGLPAPMSNICTWFCDLGCGAKSFQSRHNIRAATLP